VKTLEKVAENADLQAERRSVMGYIQGENRDQATMFPPVLDEYIGEDNQVRFIDAFVDHQIDMSDLGFRYSEVKETGRRPYNPADNLKLYIYGYLNRIRSSRRLETETYKNIELMWLIRRLHPDHKTIADFRRDNRKALREVCRKFSLYCYRLGLFRLEFFAVDGSKFAAVNHNSRVYNKEKLAELIKRIDVHIDEYLQTLDKSDEEEKEIDRPTAEDMDRKIGELKERRNLYESYQQELESSGETQIAVTDSDSRMMRTGNQGFDASYNVQAVVDYKHNLLVEYEATNHVNDLGLLSEMVGKVKTAYDLESFSVAADAGYFDKDEIKACIDEKAECYVPEPKKSKNAGKGRFTNRDFQYDPSEDCYICPAGFKLTRFAEYVRHGRNEFVFKTKSCRTCPIRIKCTTSKEGRRIFRWEHEHIIEEMKKKMLENPQYMQARRNMAEHPFGTIKRAFGFTHFLCRGLEMVNAEMSLTILAYNMRRVLSILSMKEIMAALN
jgi:transposase